MDWIFVEDREGLDGVSREELRYRFRDWVRSENTRWENIDDPIINRGTRYSFFVELDEPALLSFAMDTEALYPTGSAGVGGPYIKIIRGWNDAEVLAAAMAAEAAEAGNEGEDEYDGNEDEDEYDETEDEDCKKIQVSELDIESYLLLDNDEAWYTFRRICLR
ncbi:hypothetical protein F5B18DRAFT_639195 [Nemania serpens]|nr:hypothetical protein F5B18DRAFT_639195 [Nemania serpens]